MSWRTSALSGGAADGGERHPRPRACGQAIVLPAVGSHTLRQTRASRFSAGFGPRSVNLVFRF